MSALAALLAAAPALPLDEAGKYVAGAFIVFLAAIVIYVGIMGVRLQRMSRELGELNRVLDLGEHGARSDRARDEAGPAS